MKPHITDEQVMTHKPDYDCYAKAKMDYQEAIGGLVDELRNVKIKPEYQAVLNRAIEVLEKSSESVRLRVL
jgi:hypothetical protein